MFNYVFQSPKKSFIPFIMAGHPSMDETKRAILALASAGADLIELGVPFSDPVADGLINQQAAEVALANGVNLRMILALVKSIRQSGCDTPIILFSYFNPIVAFGGDAFAIEAAAAGVDGVLIVDLPPEEGEAFYGRLKLAGLGVVLLVSPTTNPLRFDVYKRVEPAFIYYISRLSVTGVQDNLSPQLASEMQTLKTYFPSYPIVVGFGVSTVEQAQTVAELADGVVVGSLLVKTLDMGGVEALKTLAQQFARVVHSG